MVQGRSPQIGFMAKWVPKLERLFLASLICFLTKNIVLTPENAYLLFASKSQFLSWLQLNKTGLYHSHENLYLSRY